MGEAKKLVSYAEIKAPTRPRPHKRPRKINPRTGGHRFPKLVNEPLRAFVRGLECILAGRRDRAGVLHRCRTAPMVCHLKTRGAAGPDDENIFPGCWEAHQEQEGQTKEFEYQWQLRLKPLCRKITAAFYREYPELRKYPLETKADAH